jgi:hypothetical protein
MAMDFPFSMVIDGTRFPSWHFDAVLLT